MVQNHCISLKSLSLPWDDSLPFSKMIVCSHTLLLSEFPYLDRMTDIAIEDDEGAIIGWVPYQAIVKAIFDQWKSYKVYYETLLNSVDDAITVIDHNSTIISWNKKSEEIYNRSSDEVLGQQITDFFDEQALVVKAMLKEEKAVVRKYNQPHPNVHVLINALPVYMDNHIIGGISVERDISEIVKLSDELSNTTAYLHDLKTEIEKEHERKPFEKVKGKSAIVRTAIDLANKVSSTDATVLITGESGVGKELFASAIHKGSSRSSQPFVAINCGAIPTSLFESELFGYEKGAFTGATKSGKKGKLDVAMGGTLFLDEIGEMPLELQVKLLRVLQEKQFYRVGGNEALPVNLRIIAATNKNLVNMIQAGTFREDLYYRLNVISLSIPPLRDRIEDIPELIQLFLKEFSVKYSKWIPQIDPEVMYNLLHHPWPGNIRQLRNIIERIIILGGEDGVIKLHHLPNDFIKTEQHKQPDIQLIVDDTEMLLNNRTNEETLIKNALQKTYGNKSAAAKLLGVSRATLYNKMKKMKEQNS